MRSIIRALAISAVAVSAAHAQAIRSTGGFSMNTLARNDDGSTGLVNVGFTFNLFGLSRNQVYVNNNGNITFSQALGTFTPRPIANGNLAIIAPFWADVDTRNPASGVTRYGTGTVGGRNVFAVDWIDVGYFSNQVNRLNSFQLWLVDRSDIGAGDFDFEFNYDKIQWDTGEASGGTANGLCADPSSGPARAGWANGLAATFELAGSGACNAFLDGGPNSLVAGSLNSDVAGRYVFSVRNGVVQPPNVVPEPSTYVLMATGLAGLAALQRRRRA
ncbi:MAG: PEP-CTERM sorting domain-containing protein [Gemmatimonadaceae bacterium]|jgi:hypothetical protein|nr:PEP-CTERM sorting domain-containing protein [Gemmatimonadaceae bacterium]